MIELRISHVLSLVVLLCLPAVVYAKDWSQRPAPPLHSIDHNGLKRSYHLYLPPAYKVNKKLPLVVMLHGGGRGDGAKSAKYLGFTTLAKQKGFIVAYPNGVDSYWRDGRGYTHRGNSDASVDDVGFISALIDHLIENNKADPARVYVTGVSNGGMMTLRLGCALAPKLAAIAPVIANIPKNIIGGCRPEVPLSVLLMNGTEDPLVPWGGGYVHFFHKDMGQVVSTEKTIDFWVEHDRCNPKGHTVKLPDRDKSDHSTVEVTRYKNTKDHVEVVLYKIVGGGHNLPGSDTRERLRITGRKNNDINGAKEIWDFFQKYTRR
jgi:polyhydroxybutyrate depolymerase